MRCDCFRRRFLCRRQIPQDSTVLHTIFANKKVSLKYAAFCNCYDKGYEIKNSTDAPVEKHYVFARLKDRRTYNDEVLLIMDEEIMNHQRLRDRGVVC